ncbi:PadR family transcriptional regulator [Cytophagaceae bacterium AH-315-L13]|nr:PadR family transcriptional regulator [Cytophagaceae bacterium AH-315-L13]
MDIENVKIQMRKGILEYCILSIISKHKEVYASDILQMLKEGKLIVVEGTLYPLLTRLRKSELLNYRWEESLSGPPRKYYNLTEKGEKFVEELNMTWEDLLYAVNITTKKHLQS